MLDLQAVTFVDNRAKRFTDRPIKRDDETVLALLSEVECEGAYDTILGLRGSTCVELGAVAS